ncbi:unnamed protein product, partial [Brassica oleracea var. botrytis]
LRRRLTVKSSGMARPSQICLVVQFDKEVDTDKFITQIFST